MGDLKRGKSIASIGLVLVGLLIGACITYIALSTTNSPTPVVQTITLPVVFPLTGEFASWGQSSANAANLAVKIMDANLNSTESSVRFQTVVVDDGGTEEGAQAAVNALYENVSAKS